jgi:biopolymer transport protein ExbD
MKFEIPGAEGEEELQMAPLIDMVFLLLIFFMVASHLNQLDKIPIEPPVAPNAAVPEDLTGRRTITVAADETIHLGTSKGDLEQVGPMVEKALETLPDLKIFLRADGRVPHKRVREVMKACAEAGAAEIIFATYEAE